MYKLRTVILLALLTAFSGCELVGDIFEAGVWTGILIVVAIIAGIIFLFSKITRK